MLEKIVGFGHFQIDLLVIWLLLQGAVLSLPEEIVVITLGTLWAHHKVNFFEALVACQMGLIPANCFMVVLGNKIGYRLLEAKIFSWIISKKTVNRVLPSIRKNGSWVVFISRFSPSIRGAVYFSIGLSKMPIRQFVTIDFIASCFQIPLLLFLGSLIGKRFKSVEELYHIIFVGAFIIIGGTILGLVIHKIIMVMKQRFWTNDLK